MPSFGNVSASVCVLEPLDLCKAAAVAWVSLCSHFCWTYTNFFFLNLSIYNRNYEVQKFQELLLPPLHVECLFLETGLDGLGSSRIPLRQAVLEAAQGLHQKISTLSPCPVRAALFRPRIAESKAFMMATSLVLECTMGFSPVLMQWREGCAVCKQEEHQRGFLQTLTVRMSLWGVLKK